VKRWPWDLLFALLAGIAGGLLYAWVIAPPQVTLTPDLLRPADREAYYEVIAAAYAANGDLERARARLSLFSEQAPASLAAQAQRMLAAGRPFEEIQPLVRLAADLGKPTPPAQPPATPLALVTPLPPPSPTSPATPPPEEITPEPPPTEETLAIPTLPLVTPQSAFTPVPTVGGFFTLSDYRTLCDPERTPGLLQVWVNDERGQPLPGVPLLLVWEGGQEVFYTGLKPELGNGYADALLQAERLYSLQVGGGEPISNLSAPSCPPESGLRYGSIALTFTRK
jgi:hypothetical protein